MSERADRFRRLSPRRNGDLFEHFGIALEPASPEPLPAVRLARACPQCGWYAEPGGVCDNCGASEEVA